MSDKAAHGPPKRFMHATRQFFRGDQLYATVVGELVAGVCAGLVLTGFQAIYDAGVAKSERSDQMEFFRTWGGAMRKVCDISEPFDAGQHLLPADQVRYIRARSLVSEVRRALEGRSSRFTFDEKDQVERARLEADGYLSPMGSLSETDLKGSLPKEWCRELLNNFEKTLVFGGSGEI